MEPAQSKVIIIPEGYDQTQREQIGQDIVDTIKRRTLDGIDAGGNIFAPYSRSYEKTGTVNLKVTGDMLAGLIVLSTGRGFVRIGFDSTFANDKAAYIQSPRGQKAGNQPVRRFVGITQQDLSIILRRYPLN